jgi:hypothetical protein
MDGGGTTFWEKKLEQGRVCLQLIREYVLNIRADNISGHYNRYVGDTLDPLDLRFIPMFVIPELYTKLGVTRQGDSVYVLNERAEEARETMKQRGCASCALRDRDHILFDYAKKAAHDAGDEHE